MANKEQYLKRAKELGIKNADSFGWNELRSAVSEAENALENTGTNPDDNQEGSAEDTTQEESTTDTQEYQTQNEDQPYFEDENGQRFGFTKRTPEKFRFNGVIKTQAEWLKDTDAMEMLVYGNSMYIKPLN